jgi:hypothetical protein
MSSPRSRAFVGSPVHIAEWRSLVRPLVLLIACPTFLLAQDSAPAPATIHGTVLNSITREPIARALVTSQNDSYAALTDDQGHFSFNLPTSSSSSFFESFHAGKPGYLDDEGSNVGTGGSPAGAPDLVFTLVPESLIVGRVVLPSAGSFDRINVELYRRAVNEGRAQWFPTGSERARSNGEFRFSGLAAGTYKIFTSELLDRDPLTSSNDPDAQQFGYPPAYFPTASDFSSAAPITLAAGQTFEAELTPTLHPYFPIKISLPNVQAGTGVNVSVAAANHRGPGFSLGYNGQTQAIEGMLPSGSYSVEAVSYGPTTASGVLSITVRDAPLLTPTLLLLPSQSIPVNLKEEFTAADKKNAANVSVVTRIGGSSGVNIMRGVSSINVRLVPADNFSPAGGAQLDRTGSGDASLRLTGVIPGVYWLRIYGSGYPASATSGGVDLLLNPLVVGPGGSSPPIDITMRDDTAEIDGTVEDSASNRKMRSGAPTVYCVPLPDSPGSPQQASMQISQEDVQFHCQSLAPGSYRVLAFEHSQPEFEYRDAEAMRPYESKGPVVRVAGGQKESVRISVNQ